MRTRSQVPQPAHHAPRHPAAAVHVSGVERFVRKDELKGSRRLIATREPDASGGTGRHRAGSLWEDSGGCRPGNLGLCSARALRHSASTELHQLHDPAGPGRRNRKRNVSVSGFALPALHTHVGLSPVDIHAQLGRGCKESVSCSLLLQQRYPGLPP
jgi:hypothetical protein